jgi:hypothetical protein
VYVSNNFLIFFVICVRFQHFSKYYFFGFFEKYLKKLSEKYEYVSNIFFKNSVQKMEYVYVSYCSEFPDIRAVTFERPDVPIPCMGTSTTSKMSSFLHGIFKNTFFSFFSFFFSILLFFLQYKL